jgi:hypothetical protein
MADQPNSIFENQNSGTTIPQSGSTSTEPNTQPNTKLTDLLNGIKNERGEPKYKTLEDALLGLQHAQEYIPNLKKTLTEREQELENLRKEQSKIAELEASVRRLSEQSGDEGKPPKSLTEQDVAELVAKSLETTLTQREQQVIQKNNLNTVVLSLQSTFGDAAETKYNEKAAEFGMSVAEFNALAARSPMIVLTALGVKASTNSNTQAPNKGSVNSGSLQTPTETLVGRNKVPTLIGATTQDVQAESKRANQMVDELHKEGRSVHDLTDPKVYFKHFGGV